MRKILYAVAMSVDGYLAGPNGEADWIGLDPEVDFAATWAQFDTLLMGRRTYEVARKRLGEAAFARNHHHRLLPDHAATIHPEVTVVSELNSDWVRELQPRSGKDIRFGGSELFRSFPDFGQVDTVEASLPPVLLGSGVPLLPPPHTPAKLRLHSYKICRSGRVALAYEVQH